MLLIAELRLFTSAQRQSSFQQGVRWRLIITLVVYVALIAAIIGGVVALLTYHFAFAAQVALTIFIIAIIALGTFTIYSIQYIYKIGFLVVLVFFWYLFFDFINSIEISCFFKIFFIRLISFSNSFVLCDCSWKPSSKRNLERTARSSFEFTFAFQIALLQSSC